MTGVDIVLIVFAGLLAVAAMPAIYRMVVGPTILDRAVALDMMVVIAVMLLALYSARTGTAWAMTAMLSLTALAFVGTVVVARFVAREGPRPRGLGGREATARGAEAEPHTHTGAHEPIHPSNGGSSEEPPRGGAA